VPVNTNCIIRTKGAPDPAPATDDPPPRPYPEGDPCEDWKGVELDAWCQDNGVADYQDARTKADVMDLIDGTRD